MLKLESELHISNLEKKQIAFFLQQYTVEVKYYKQIIKALLSLIFAKQDKFLLYIKRFIK